MDDPQITVLLVEDDEDDFIIIRDLFADIQGPRFKLDWVTTYDAGLKTVNGQQYDVYLVDYHLGEKTGLEFLADALRIGCKAPIIMLTGSANRQVDLAAMQAGASDFLTKGSINTSLLERSIRYACERARLLNSLSELTIRDELTGLNNRRELYRLLEEHAALSQRYGSLTSVIMIDIDHFKVVNDTHGHLVGDQVLKWIGKFLRENVRSVDKAARFGGEEFAIILPETSKGRAYIVAERIRRNINAQACIIKREDGTPVKISISLSLGVAELPSDAVTRDALIEAADQALYSAKCQGRNKTVAYGSQEK